MGWTFPYGATRRQVIEELTPAERSYGENAGGGCFRTLRHCCKGNVLYALHESVKGDGSSLKWIGIYLLQRSDGSWGYKDMDESMHPYYYNCPVSYLDAADEPTSDSAKAWRDEVRRQAAERAKQNAKRPKVGERWSCHGANCKEIRIVEVKGRRIVARNLGAGGGLYRIPKKLLGEKLEDAPKKTQAQILTSMTSAP